MSDDAVDVTCVLIFLDGARFIEEAIASVVAQGDHVAWELVLVDDGSTDESTAIARRWAQADPRIRYLEHPGHANLGMSASRNAGVAAARGRLVGFLDCDDVWLPGSLAHVLRDVALHPDVDVVISGTWRWHGWTGDPADAAQDHLMSLPDVPTDTVIAPPALFGGMYGTPGAWRIPAMCSLLITRAGLVRIGGLEASFRGLYEDQVLYAKVALHLRAIVDPRPMGLYRQHPGSTCQVAIAAGEWQREGRSEPEQRYLEWMGAYVPQEAGGDAVVLDVVTRNLDFAAGGRHLAPTEPAPRVRDRLPLPVRKVLRALRWRLRPGVPPPSVLERWSEQFLRPLMAPTDGTLLVVEGGRSWDEVATGPGRVDRIVVPLAAGERVPAATLLEVVARRLAPGGWAGVLVPGPALDADRPDGAALVAMAGTLLPSRHVTVTSFGNATTRDALDAPGVDLGPTVDRHDPAVPVVLGVTIWPAGCSR